jgi:hypothetical protein
LLGGGLVGTRPRRGGGGFLCNGMGLGGGGPLGEWGGH